MLTSPRFYNRRLLAAVLAFPMLIACESTNDPGLDCVLDPSGAGCIATAVGAARVIAADEVQLVNVDGDRLVTWSISDGSFSAASDLSAARPTYPLATIGAWTGETSDQTDYLFDSSGGSYTEYDRGTDSYDPVDAFPGTAWATPDVSDVGALIHAANTSRIFVFDRAGTTYQLWNYNTESWSPGQDFATEWGGGSTPISTVGAGVLVDRTYYLFDTTGTMWMTYDADALTFAGPFAIGDLGDGTLNFN